MFGCSSICCCSRLLINGWNWLAQKTYIIWCSSRSSDLDEQLPFDPYSLPEEKHVIVELLNEYDD